MEYLTYPQYQAMGGQLSMSEFTPLEYACRKRIDLLTDCRVQPMADAGAVPEAVRMCMFALINLESKVGITAQVDNPVATSFNTDGYSESYGNLPKAGRPNSKWTLWWASTFTGKWTSAASPSCSGGAPVKLCNDVITIFNAYLDKDRGADIYLPTVISGVSWYLHTITTVDSGNGACGPQISLRCVSPSTLTFPGKPMRSAGLCGGR